MEPVRRLLEGMLDVIDQRRVVRRIQVGVLLWMLVDCYLWARGYAESSKLTGAELALVVGAVNWPITALMGFIYKQYEASRA